MLKTKYDVFTRNGKDQFVVVPVKDFEALLEKLEDDADYRDFQAAKKRNAGKPGISHERMLQELGLKATRRKAKARA